MIDLVMIVPSRQRPGTARDIAAEFTDTCAARTLLAIVVDESDPLGADYGRALDAEPVSVRAATGREWAEFAERGVGVFRTPSRTMEEALNQGAATLRSALDPFAIGYLGDDHRPRTPGWDRRFVDELRDLGSGIAYAEDLVEGRALPTQAVLTADVVRELGFMIPPGLSHLYAGAFWRDLGTAADCLRFVPDVVVERLNAASAGPEDKIDLAGRHDPDRVAYRAYAEGRLPADAERVRRLRSAVPA